MAAALWHGGISFGGVITFIFADLLALPLIFIYRKYYGGRLALRLVGGLLRRDGGRRAWPSRGCSPASAGSRPSGPKPSCSTGFHLDVTLVLNVVVLIVLGAVYWLYRNRDRFGGGDGLRHRPDLRHAGAHRRCAGVVRRGRRAGVVLLGPLP